MKNRICYYTLLLLLSCAACNPSPYQENYISLKNEIWDRDSDYKFEIDIQQPGTYTMSTCIRHTTDYRNKSISCYLIISHPRLPDMTEILDVTITNENGAWAGQGLGGLRTVAQPVNRVFHLDSTGIYTVEIRHRMKGKKLEGIKNLGIKVIKYKD